VHRGGPPISLRSWLYLIRAWPRILIIDAMTFRLFPPSNHRRK
jgi:hypothetical protein